MPRAKKVTNGFASIPVYSDQIRMSQYTIVLACLYSGKRLVFNNHNKEIDSALFINIRYDQISTLVVPPRNVGSDFPSFFHLAYSAVAANITSPEELSAVSTES